MAMCDWTELEVLGRKIADAEDRLASARSTQNCGLVQLLEKEIAAAETLRDRVVSQIATGLTSKLMMPRDSVSLETSSAPPPIFSCYR